MKYRNLWAVFAFAVLALAAAAFPELLPLHAASADTGAGFGLAALGAAPLIIGETDVLKKALSDMETGLKKVSEDVAGYTAKASDEIKRLGAITAETSGKLTEIFTASQKLGEDMTETKQRLLALEQAGARRAPEHETPKTAGQIVIASPEFKALHARSTKMDPVHVGAILRKTAIVNATGASQPLVQADRLDGIVPLGTQMLTMRDLLPVIPTGSNLIEFAREATEDIEAAPQYASPNRENVAKKESAMTFELADEAVQTLAHWIPASRQVLSDSAMLAGFVDTRLRYGLALEEEDQILNGDGTGGDLNGIITQAAAYTGATSGDTPIDTLLRAMNQVALSGYVASGHVLHPTDLTGIRLTKDTTGRYIFGDPMSAGPASIWGLPVRQTQKITAGTFLTGSFVQGAALFDREDASVRVAEQHSDFFVKNMVVVLVEERVALVVYRGTAFVTGNLP